MNHITCLHIAFDGRNISVLDAPYGGVKIKKCHDLWFIEVQHVEVSFELKKESEGCKAHMRSLELSVYDIV
jgi:hypothetical protein